MKPIEIFPWNEYFNTGLPIIDKQHQRLVQLLNLLASHIAHQSGFPSLNTIFDELADYAVYHFQTEESIWHEHLPDVAMVTKHKAEHNSFILRVNNLIEGGNSKPLNEVTYEILSFLAHWLTSHILETDRHLAMVVQAIQTGMSLELAKTQTNEQINGTTKVLRDLLLSSYGDRITNTLHLMSEVAERKVAELTLKRSDSRFRKILEDSPLGLATTTLDGHFILVNRAFCSMLGYEKDELEKLTFAEVTHPEDITLTLEDRQKLLDGVIGTYKKEKRFLRKDGQAVWGQITSSLEKDAYGRPTYYIAQVENITERKQLDKERQRNADQYLTLIKSSLDGFLCIDTSGSVIDANEAACKMYGYSRDEFLKLKVWDVDAEETPEESAAHIAEIIEAKQVRFETKHRRKDSCIIDVEASVSYLTEFGDRFFGFFRDITERKKNEKIIQDSEERLRLVLLAGEQGWFDVNVQTGEVTVSPEYVRMLGYDPDTFHASLDEWKGSLHPDDCDTVMHAFRECLENGESNLMEYRRRSASGDWIWVATAGKVTEWDQNGLPLRVIGSHTNINDRKVAEIAIHESETRFRTIIEESPIGMAFARDGITNDVNSIYLQMFGYDEKAEVIGHPLLDQIAPQCKTEMEDRIRRRQKGEQVEFSYETVGLRKDGSQFPLLISARRIVLKDGPVTFGFLIDISQREESERQIR